MRRAARKSAAEVAARAGGPKRRSTTRTELNEPKTPPRWFNAVVRAALRTPGVRRALGETLAELTVTGARTGTRYAIPVQALVWHGRTVVLTLRRRTWWRNLRARPVVALVQRGERSEGRATIAGRERARTALADCLEEHPRVAKFYGVEPGPNGAIEDPVLDQLFEMLTVIVIDTDLRTRPGR